MGKRPKVQLFVPSRIVPGRPAELRTELTFTRAVKVNAVTIELVGQESNRVGTEDATWRRTELVRLRAELLGRRLLPARGAQGATIMAKGVRSLPATFHLPAGCPPSYESPTAHVRYEAHVHVDIPVWPDKRQTFVVPVAAAPPAAPVAGRPQVVTTDARGPRGSQPHLEVSLAADVVEPGGVLSGAVALGNQTRVHYRGVRVALQAVESSLANPRRGTVDGAAWAVELPPPRGEGGSRAFAMTVPSSVAPEFDGRHLVLRYVLEVTARVAFASDLSVRIPIQVVPQGGRVGDAGRARPAPRVGAERVSDIWRHVAARFGLAIDGERLVGQEGGVRVAIWAAPHKREPALHAELDYAPLGLGLAVKYDSWQVPGRGAKVTGGAWDRYHSVSGRDPRQAQGALRLIARELRAFETPVMSDERAQLRRRGVDRESAGLEAFVGDVRALAQALERARAAFPPPEDYARHVASWLDLAGALGGELAPADMKIVGALDGKRVELGVTWPPGAARPDGVAVRVWPEHELDWPASGMPADPAAAAAWVRLGATPSWNGRVLGVDHQGVWSGSELEPVVRGLVELARRLRKAAGVFR